MPEDGFAGSMVATMSLSSNGECLGGDGEPDATFYSNGIAYSFWDLDGDGQMDKMGYSLPDGEVVVVDLNTHPWADAENLSWIMPEYDPELWPTVDEYLYWVEDVFDDINVDNSSDIPGDHSLNKKKLPKNNNTNVQVPSLCVFKTMEWIGKYFGKKA